MAVSYYSIANSNYPYSLNVFPFPLYGYGSFGLNLMANSYASNAYVYLPKSFRAFPFPL